MEFNTSQNYLGEPKYGLYSSSSFPTYYLRMFGQLKDEGCSIKDLQKASISRSLTEFKSYLIARYPDKDAIITSIIQKIDTVIPK